MGILSTIKTASEMEKKRQLARAGEEEPTPGSAIGSGVDVEKAKRMMKGQKENEERGAPAKFLDLIKRLRRPGKKEEEGADEFEKGQDAEKVLGVN